MDKKKRQPKAAVPPPSIPQQQVRSESRMEDSRLIHRALAGDHGSYKRLMTKYHDQIFSFILRMVRDRTQVEDLTQEAFVKAFASLKNFNEEYAFSTWLYKIATNNCIDYIRKRKLLTFSIDKPIQSKDSEYMFELPDETYRADKQIIAKQKAIMLNEAIQRLPEKYKRVIHLRHTEEWSYEEIAKALKLPIGTVKAHIFRAREMLYKALRNRIRHY
jgi:RNA polymerase sigma-70 factor (ECF subfamily)